MILYGGGAPSDGVSDVGGGGTGMALKKGPWTAAEDEVLAAYVREHGEGNWNAVQKNTGLARCGKSCRLRWANHLRPNLKKGAFTAEEERLIIQLHAQLGNKWARMAAQLPGRTDNEIKNYWNTRLKRLQRQGLPPLLQPPSSRAKRFSSGHCTGDNSSDGFIPSASSVNTSVTCGGGISAGPFSPMGKSSYASFLTLPYSSPATPTGATSYHNTNESSPLLVSSCPSSSPLQSFSLNHPSSPFHHSSSSPNHHLLHTHFTPSSLQSTEPVYSMKLELPSNQMSHSAALGIYDVTSLTDNEKHHHHHHHQSLDMGLHRRSNCELLENVLDEAEAMAGNGRTSKRRQVMDFTDENNNVLGSFGHCGTSNGLCSSQGLKQAREDESVQMNTMQEDIAKLLDWGSDSGEISNGHSSVVTDDNLVLDVHQFASLFPVEASATDNEDPNKNTTSCSWDNLPGIC